MAMMDSSLILIELLYNMQSCYQSQQESVELLGCGGNVAAVVGRVKVDKLLISWTRGKSEH